MRPYWNLTLSVVNPPADAIGEHIFEIVDRLVNFPNAKESPLFYKIVVTGDDLSKNNTPPYFKNKESDWGPHCLQPGEVVELEFEIWDDENQDDRTKVFLKCERIPHGKLAGDLNAKFSEHFFSTWDNDLKTLTMVGSNEFQGEYFEYKIKVTDHESQG